MVKLRKGTSLGGDMTEVNYQLTVGHTAIGDWKNYHFWQSVRQNLERKQRALLIRKQREMSDLRPNVQSNILLGWFSQEN